MKKKIILLFCLLFPFLSYSQSAEGRYVSRMTQDGTLFFINPQKLSKKSGIRKFEYDMTLLSWTDSITVNFTFETDRMSAPKRFDIIIGNDSYQCTDFKPLFIDIKKNHFEIRITSKFPYQILKEFVSSTTPPYFAIWQDNIKETATYSNKNWEKERKKLTDIFNLYQYTR